MGKTIDLNALAPEPVIVKLGDEEITIEPPRTADFLRLGVLGQKMAEAQDLSAAELEVLIGDLTDQVYKCAPGIASKPLNTAQLLKLVTIITEMGMPEDAKELKARGITADTSKKAP